MDRVNQLRNARNSPHVSFAEYIKLRARSKGIVLVFEGKECPAAYIGWLRSFFRAFADFGGQIIARGKKNVLALRDIIRGNPASAADRNIYFVDRDYDVEPKPGSFPDVYVTRGYSIENEVVSWSAIESYARAYFDIADSDDHDALQIARNQFDKVFAAYIAEAGELHRIIYLCRTKGIGCLPGVSVMEFIDVDWVSGVVRRRYKSVDELLGMLKIEHGEWPAIHVALAGSDGFADLSPTLDWRGKFHFSLARCFLIHLRQARTLGAYPFRRPAKVSVDPAHSNLIGLLGSMCVSPACLRNFVEAYLTAAEPISVHQQIGGLIAVGQVPD